MSTAVLKELIEERAIFLPLRVKQYHAMIANGILPEGAPYELLDGYLVRKDRSATGESPMTVGYHHAWVVAALAKLDVKLQKLGCIMRTQQPVSLPPFNEPEPDGAILLGTEDDYRGRLPSAKDVLCVIEVSDASLRHDRIVKGRIYASAGIAQFVLINLAGRVVEVYTRPSRKKGAYANSAIVHLGQRVSFPAARGETLAVQVRTLLP